MDGLESYSSAVGNVPLTALRGPFSFSDSLPWAFCSRRSFPVIRQLHCLMCVRRTWNSGFVELSTCRACGPFSFLAFRIPLLSLTFQSPSLASVWQPELPGTVRPVLDRQRYTARTRWIPRTQNTIRVRRLSVRHGVHSARPLRRMHSRHRRSVVYSSTGQPELPELFSARPLLDSSWQLNGMDRPASFEQLGSLVNVGAVFTGSVVEYSSTQLGRRTMPWPSSSQTRSATFVRDR